VALDSDKTQRWSEVQTPATLTIQLRRGTVVRGIVYLPGGQPAAGAWVEVIAGHAQLRDGTRYQKTDFEGRFCFPCIQVEADEQSMYAWVFAMVGPFRGSAGERVPPDKNEVDVVVNLEERPLIQGIVTDLQERPLPNAAAYAPWDTRFPPFSHSDENGYFQVPVYGQAWVVKEGYAPQLVEHEQLKTTAEANGLLRVRLPRDDGRVAGRVLFHDGTPLRNEMVEIMASNKSQGRLLAWRRNVVLGDDGEFELTGISVEGNKFEFFDTAIETADIQFNWYPDRESRDVKVSATAKAVPLGATDVIIRFGPIFEARGTVIDAESGAGIDSVPLHVWGEGYSRKTRSDSSGRFRLPWMTPGTYFANATSPGFFPVQKKIEITMASRDIGTMFLHKTLIAQGRVVYEKSGSPAAGAQVHLSAFMYIYRRDNPGGPRTFTQGTTDAGGYFRIPFSNPFTDMPDPSDADFHLSLGIIGGALPKWIRFNSSQAGPDGVINFGRIEVQPPAPGQENAP
jgi:5-hydroxyisourate hydrolase-like protein (transthyretin family)